MKIANIANSFSKAASTYEDYAIVQRQSARLLANQLQRIQPTIPAGPVLEIACGTGLFTEQLVTVCRDRHLTISDISESMLKICQNKFDTALEFVVLDAENLAESDRYALIVCSFGAQWFKHIDTTFDGIIKALVHGGLFLFCVPTQSSFAEWKAVCSSLRVPFTGNTMPSAKLIEDYCNQRALSADLSTTWLTSTYPSSLAFFRSLRNLGAQIKTTSLASTKTESQKAVGTYRENAAAQLKTLMRQWDKESNGHLTVTYEILCGVVKKT